MNILLYLGTGLGANLGARIRAYIGTNLAHLGAGIRIRTRATMRGMTGQRLARLPLALATLASTAPRMLSTGAARGVHSLLPLLACLLLVACGGGGGGGGGGGATALSPDDVRTSYTEVRGNAEDDANAPAVVTAAKANAIEVSAFFTRAVQSDTGTPLGDDDYGQCKYCGTDSSDADPTSDENKAACFDEIGDSGAAYGFRVAEFDPGASGVGAGPQTNNIPLFLGTVTGIDVDTPEVTNTTELWGGWMGGSYFTAVSWQEDTDGDDLHHFGGYAIGNPYTSNPVTSGADLTWTGAMVAYGHSNARFNHRVRGQARVTVDSQVDVSFTDIVDLTSDTTLDDIHFLDMNMTQGTFNYNLDSTR